MTDELTTLRAQVESLTRENGALLKKLREGTECYGHMVDAPGEPLDITYKPICVIERERAEQAERERDALRGVLEEIRDNDPHPSCRENARAALAREEGGG